MTTLARHCAGQSPDGQKAFVAYWIMGRSANSRNRVFEPIDGGIRTVAADPAKLEDPHSSSTTLC